MSETKNLTQDYAYGGCLARNTPLKVYANDILLSR